MVERVGRFADGVRGREVNLFAPVGCVGGDFVAEFVVTWRRQ